MQVDLFPKGRNAYGGDLLKTRKGRSAPRPLSARHSMHLVLRSSKAKGRWSFRNGRQRGKIKNILEKFCGKYAVQLLSSANVGNHLHLHIKLSNRHTYKAFIRGITSAIAMAVTGFSRWNKPPRNWKGFWDCRPFTRVLVSFAEFLNLNDYLYINRLEGFGYRRDQAEYIVRRARKRRARPG